MMFWITLWLLLALQRVLGVVINAGLSAMEKPTVMTIC